MAYSLWQMTQFTAEVGTYEIVRTGVIQGVALGFIFVPMSTITFATLAARFRNEGTAMFSLIRNIGSSIGISVVDDAARPEHTGEPRGARREHHAVHARRCTVRGCRRSGTVTTTRALAALYAAVNRQAVTLAYLNDFRLMMYMTPLAAPLLLLIRGRRDERLPKARHERRETGDPQG